MKSLVEIKKILEETPQNGESKKSESFIYTSKKTNSQQNTYTTRAKVEETKNQKIHKIEGADIFGYNQKFDVDNILTGIAKRFLVVTKSRFKNDEKIIRETQKVLEKAVETKKRITLAKNKEKIATTILWKTDKSFDKIFEKKAVETKTLTASPATPVNDVPNKFNMNTILVVLIIVLLITIIVKSIKLKQDKKQKPM